MNLLNRCLVTILLCATSSAAQSQQHPASSKNAQPSPPWPNAVHISPKDGEGHVVKQTVARYSFEAKNMHVTGTVVLRILISQTGDVKDMLLVEGDRRLVPACVDAVKRWKYKPFVRDGEPVEVDMTTQCHFDMSGG